MRKAHFLRKTAVWIRLVHNKPPDLQLITSKLKIAIGQWCEKNLDMEKIIHVEPDGNWPHETLFAQSSGKVRGKVCKLTFDFGYSAP